MKKNKKIYPSPPLLTEKLISHDFFLEDEESFIGSELSNTDQSYGEASSLLIRDSHLRGITMQRATLERFECSNVIVENCDFSNLEWIGGSFHQVLFKQCKLTGINFAESYLRDCQFENCLTEFSSFNTTKLDSTAFIDCRLDNSEFEQVTWKNLLFEGCFLSSTVWFDTSLNGLDLTKNKFQSIALSRELISGLIVNQEQALTIAETFGMIIQE